MKNVRIHIHAVPEDQHRKIKVAAAIAGESLQHFVLKAALTADTTTLNRKVSPM